MNWKDLHPNKIYQHYLRETKKINAPYIDREDYPDLIDAFDRYEDWKKGGSNVFVASDEIISMFLNTSIDGVSCSQIKPPYDNYYVAFQSPVNDFLGFYVDDLKEVSPEIIIAFVRKDAFFGGENNEYISLTDGLTVKEVINEDESVFGKKDTPKELAINFLLYLSLPKTDIIKQYPADTPQFLIDKLEKAHTKRKKQVVAQEIEQAGFTKLNIVGSSFKSSHTNGEGGTTCSHWRRGHWRNQPYGVQLSDKRLIWIQPTIVNPQLGEPEKGHLYI